ncbi:MAG: hypothetical protein ABIJ12_11695 [bacterium]
MATLRKERDAYKELFENEKCINEKLKRQVRAYKGIIKKMKEKK